MDRPPDLGGTDSVLGISDPADPESLESPKPQYTLSVLILTLAYHSCWLPLLLNLQLTDSLVGIGASGIYVYADDTDGRPRVQIQLSQMMSIRLAHALGWECLANNDAMKPANRPFNRTGAQKKLKSPLKSRTRSKDASGGIKNTLVSTQMILGPLVVRLRLHTAFRLLCSPAVASDVVLTQGQIRGKLGNSCHPWHPHPALVGADQLWERHIQRAPHAKMLGAKGVGSGVAGNLSPAYAVVTLLASFFFDFSDRPRSLRELRDSPPSVTEVARGDQSAGPVDMCYMPKLLSTPHSLGPWLKLDSRQWRSPSWRTRIDWSKNGHTGTYKGATGASSNGTAPNGTQAALPQHPTTSQTLGLLGVRQRKRWDRQWFQSHHHKDIKVPCWFRERKVIEAMMEESCWWEYRWIGIVNDVHGRMGPRGLVNKMVSATAAHALVFEIKSGSLLRIKMRKRNERRRQRFKLLRLESGENLDVRNIKIQEEKEHLGVVQSRSVNGGPSSPEKRGYRRWLQDKDVPCRTVNLPADKMRYHHLYGEALNPTAIGFVAKAYSHHLVIPIATRLQLSKRRLTCQGTLAKYAGNGTMKLNRDVRGFKR
ncbi:hypothetical protein B0H19DRAFT_1060529 [Mycena capillaripes]|nr:hypothetical protein B0H19DRAFT_1060529 [Mycena capillaripes]